MIKNNILAVCFILLANGVFAQSIVKSDISFTIKNFGFKVSGTFSGLQANIRFNPNDLTACSIEASVPSSTVNTDNNSRDKHLKSEDYFDVVKYPKIRLKSVSFKHSTANNYTGSFNITIKEITKLIDIPFTYVEEGNTAKLKGTFPILRRDFGVGGKNLILSNEANVSVEVEITK